MLTRPGVNDRFGRKACVVVGSLIVTVGVILQTVSVTSMSCIPCFFE